MTFTDFLKEKYKEITKKMPEERFDRWVQDLYYGDFIAYADQYTKETLEEVEGKLPKEKEMIRNMPREQASNPIEFVSNEREKLGYNQALSEIKDIITNIKENK